MYDFLFELTEYSENEGEQILCEAASLESAWTILCWRPVLCSRASRQKNCGMTWKPPRTISNAMIKAKRSFSLWKRLHALVLCWKAVYRHRRPFPSDDVPAGRPAQRHAEGCSHPGEPDDGDRLRYLYASTAAGTDVLQRDLAEGRFLAADTGKADRQK